VAKTTVNNVTNRIITTTVCLLARFRPDPRCIWCGEHCVRSVYMCTNSIQLFFSVSFFVVGLVVTNGDRAVDVIGVELKRDSLGVKPLLHVSMRASVKHRCFSIERDGVCEQIKSIGAHAAFFVLENWEYIQTIHLSLLYIYVSRQIGKPSE